MFTSTISHRTKSIISAVSDLLPAHRVDGNQLHTKKYPTTLGDWLDGGKSIKSVSAKISKMIDSMHKRGILHGDLHANNIVCNPDTGDIKFIDFAEAMYIDELSSQAIARIAKFWDAELPIVTLEDLLAYEKGMWRIGYEE